MKKFKKFLYVFLLTFLIGGLFCDVMPLNWIHVEVQAATKPAAPKLVSAKPVDGSGITVKWKAVSGATGYRVYRKLPSGKWKSLKTIKTQKTVSYTDMTIGADVSYTYTVRAYKKVNGKAVWSNYDKSGVSTMLITVPKPVSAEYAGTSLIKFTWKPVKIAEGYYVYRKTNNGSWKKQADISGADIVSYEDKNVVLGTSYRYTVRAYKTIDGARVLSDYIAAGKTIKMQPPMTKLISAKANSSYDVTVKWEKIEGVTGYRVYRKQSGKNTWKSLKTLKSADLCTYKDTTAESGRTYIYTVRAYIKKDGKAYWGTYDSVGKTVKINLNAPKLVAAEAAGSSSIVLTWDTVLGADGYRVYMKQAGWKLMKTLSGGDKQTYMIKGLDPEKTYTFTVRAYKVVDGKKVYGKYVSKGINGTTKRDELKLSSERVFVHQSGYYYDLKLEGTSQIPQWRSENPEIADIRENGTIFGWKAGKTTVIGVFEDVEYKCEVIVEDPSVIAEQTILEKGESTYVTMNGTIQDYKWEIEENEFVKITVLDDNSLKVTGVKPGKYSIRATVGVFSQISFSCDITVRGKIVASDTNVTLDVGETKEIIIETDYDNLLSSGDLYSSVLSTELTQLEEGKWKLTLVGWGEGMGTIKLLYSYYIPEICEELTVTVIDSNNEATNHFKLKSHIKNNGTYSEGWYTIGYAGIYEDIPGTVYTWTISYNPTSDEYEYGVTLTSEEELLVMAMQGNPAKASTMRLQYMYYNETTGGNFIAESSLNRKTYSGQNLTFKVTESENVEKTYLNELMSVANDTMILGMEGWQTYILKNRGFDMKDVGFKAYPFQ